MAPLTHTFDIRFARAGGFTAWLQEPTNRFRWKGAGRLSISPDAITIAASRGIESVFRLAPPRRIPARDIKEVYREGAALRLEFATADSTREVVPLWVKDRETAANIVRLLPTSRTVELEESRSSAAPRVRIIDRRVVVALLAGLAIGVAATLSLVPREPASVPAARIVVPPPMAAVPEIAAPADLPRFRSPSYLLARPVIIEFNSRAEELLSAYQGKRAAIESDALTRDQFADELFALQLEWWKVTSELLEAEALAASDLADVRATLLATARHWRSFLIQYSQGMRADNPYLIADAFHVLALAERQQWRARSFAP